MRFYTVHLRPGAEPVLVREGASIAAALFGPLWLALNRAWVPAAIVVLAAVLAIALPSAVPAVGLAALLGLLGNDLRRWDLDRRGYVLLHVVAATGQDAALQRLLTERPDLAARYAPEAA
jgi:hypothetical protein